MDDKGIVKLLTQGPSPLPAKHVNSLLKHFGKAVDHFRSSDWEECNGKAGKFVEATLKALADVAKVTQPAGRAFKVEAVVNLLRQTPPGSADDSVRIVIPRCCTFVYDIASNRGGRHDPGEVDPNEMDAAAAVANMSWVVAELIRYAQKGAMNLAEAKQLVGVGVDRPATARGRDFARRDPANALPAMQGRDRHRQLGGQVRQPDLVRLQVVLVRHAPGQRAGANTAFAQETT